MKEIKKNFVFLMIILLILLEFYKVYISKNYQSFFQDMSDKIYAEILNEKILKK